MLSLWGYLRVNRDKRYYVLFGGGAYHAHPYPLALMLAALILLLWPHVLQWTPLSVTQPPYSSSPRVTFPSHLGTFAFSSTGVLFRSLASSPQINFSLNMISSESPCLMPYWKHPPAINPTTSLYPLSHLNFIYSTDTTRAVFICSLPDCSPHPHRIQVFFLSITISLASGMCLMHFGYLVHIYWILSLLMNKCSHYKRILKNTYKIYWALAKY